MSAEQIARALGGCAQRSGGWWDAKCPAHQDDRASLGLKDTDDGGVAYKCMAGCDSKAVGDALRAHGLLPSIDADPTKRKRRRTIAQAYDYRDETGFELFQVVRFDPKDFRQRRPDPNVSSGWLWELGDVRRVLYRLPELLHADRAERVYIVEGERDVDRLWTIGLVATTNPQGAGKWARTDRAALTGRHVVILHDNDEPGRRHALEVAQDLTGKAASVRILELQGLPPKGDVSDWLDAGGTAEELQRLARDAPEFSLSADDTPELEGLPQETPGGELSHDALALEWGAEVADRARHVDRWGHWYLWNGVRWARDDKRTVWTMVREFTRQRAVDLDSKMATKLRSADTIAAVVNLARSNRELAAGVEEWDRDPYLLGTPGGTVDLRTGELRDADPADQITKLTAVAPGPVNADAPLWRAFLERIFRHDLELIPFVQRALVYALTGENREHAVFFAHGQGGNGKGVLLNTTSRLLGDYAAIAPQDLLLVTQSDRHPCDMAMLRGARLVTAQELAAGRAWDEPKLKSLTGGDPITARFMRQDFFTYEPQFSLFVAGNHKPSFKGVDEAIRRRMLLLPFLQNIPAAERDPALPEELKAEWPAILRWMIDGCLDWQRGGLRPPASVRAATDDYLNAEDVLGQWVEEMCIVSARIGWTPLASLYGAWKAWCEARGQHSGTSTALSKKLDERGFQRNRTKHGVGFLGLTLASSASFGDAGDGNDGSAHIPRSDPPDVRARAHTHAYVVYGEDRHFRHQRDDGDQDGVDEGVLV